MNDTRTTAAGSYPSDDGVELGQDHGQVEEGRAGEQPEGAHDRVRPGVLDSQPPRRLRPDADAQEPGDARDDAELERNSATQPVTLDYESMHIGTRREAQEMSLTDAEFVDKSAKEVSQRYLSRTPH